MKRDTYIIKIEDQFENIEKYFLKFLKKDFDYSLKLIDWIYELTLKNFMIKYNSNKEKIQRKRGYVYWIDFGVNVGSEFNYPHFCVVIKEFNCTAIVVPISTTKQNDPEWKKSENFVLEIGSIDSLKKKSCYAMVNQIRTVSKQRLSCYRNNGKYIKIKLNTEQLDKINNAIKSLTK